MDSLLQSEEPLDEIDSGAKLPRQALRFFLNSVMALASWAALMAVGYALNPLGVPQLAILALSCIVPLIAGAILTRIRQDDMATLVWLLGLIWILIVALWILDMPTGPNQCFQCGASEKLTRTFFSIPRPSGLIDNDGPFLGTWPAIALMGYSIGARLTLRRRS